MSASDSAVFDPFSLLPVSVFNTVFAFCPDNLEILKNVHPTLDAYLADNQNVLEICRVAGCDLPSPTLREYAQVKDHGIDYNKILSHDYFKAPESANLTIEGAKIEEFLVSPGVKNPLGSHLLRTVKPERGYVHIAYSMGLPVAHIPPWILDDPALTLMYTLDVTIVTDQPSPSLSTQYVTFANYNDVRLGREKGFTPISKTQHNARDLVDEIVDTKTGFRRTTLRFRFGLDTLPKDANGQRAEILIFVARYTSTSHLVVEKMEINRSMPDDVFLRTTIDQTMLERQRREEEGMDAGTQDPVPSPETILGDAISHVFIEPLGRELRD